mmetsp:Transcript_19833/g.55737  ORF Transcript_19833/g.55737 Transcript_19833/m.55737 type:complete len:240 (-) Transcript_19833:192-911(-)
MPYTLHKLQKNGRAFRVGRTIVVTSPVGKLVSHRQPLLINDTHKPRQGPVIGIQQHHREACELTCSVPPVGAIVRDDGPGRAHYAPGGIPTNPAYNDVVPRYPKAPCAIGTPPADHGTTIRHGQDRFDALAVACPLDLPPACLAGGRHLEVRTAAGVNRQSHHLVPAPRALRAESARCPALRNPGEQVPRLTRRQIPHESGQALGRRRPGPAGGYSGPQPYSPPGGSLQRLPRQPRTRQ